MRLARGQQQRHAGLSDATMWVRRRGARCHRRSCRIRVVGLFAPRRFPAVPACRTRKAFLAREVRAVTRIFCPRCLVTFDSAEAWPSCPPGDACPVLVMRETKKERALREANEAIQRLRPTPERITEHQSALLDAYVEGALARSELKKISACPHSEYTLRARNWCRGWTDADELESKTTERKP